MKPGRKPGPRCKPKAGLTPTEKRHVDEVVASIRARWDQLFAMNKYQPQPPKEVRR